MVFEGAFDGLISSFGRSLRADERAPSTVRAYVDAAERFASFAAGAGFPGDLGGISPAHVEAFIANQLAQHSVSTAATRFRCLQQFFGFAVAEGVLVVSPMAGLSAPKAEAKPVSVFTTEELDALVGACDGRSFDDRRDAAVVWLFIDTGMRLSEMAGLEVDGLDLDAQTVLVASTGGRTRTVGFGDRCAVAVDRYLRARRAHARAESRPLWLGVRGRLTDSGVTQMLKGRALAAGVEAVSAQRFRHTFATQWLANGGSEAELQAAGGWQSRQLLARYRPA
jgi:site-specific recombinase XerD